MIKAIQNPCNIYFTLWCFYLLQGTLYESGSTISQLLLLVILCISLKDAIKVNMMKGLPVYFKGLNAMVIMYTIYWIVLLMTDGLTFMRQIGTEVSSLNYLRTAYYSLLPIYSCYYYTVKGYFRSDNYKKWVLIFVIIAIVEYFRIQRELVQLYMEAGSDRTEFTNNIGYMLLLLTPCAFIFNKKPKIQFFVYGICLLFVMLSMKRGAMLIAFVALLVFLYDKTKLISAKRKTIFFFVVILVFILLYFLFKEMLINSLYFQERINETLEGDSSGRDEIYSALLHHFFHDANVFQMFFGMGAEGTVKIFRAWAHNDWIEILTNQGVLGIFVFSFYWLAFRYNCLNKRLSLEARFALKYLFIIFFLRTLFSMSITDMNIYSSSMMGYALADGFKRDFYNNKKV